MRSIILISLLTTLAALVWQASRYSDAATQLALSEQQLMEVRSQSRERHDQHNTLTAQLRAAQVRVTESTAQAAQLRSTVAQLQAFTHPDYEALWAQAQQAARQQLEASLQTESLITNP